jgi:CelD/BcsL family acetyltransferase involved in cellulose biosynthesis
MEVHEGDPEPLLALWGELHAGQAGATPFMHPGWAGPWWRHYGDGARPFVVATDGGLAAFALRRRAGQRVLEPWGIEPGDYWDVLAPPGGREAVALGAARVLMDRAADWEAALLRCLPPDSPVEAALRGAGAAIGLSRPIPAPAIELPESFDAYLGSLSKSRRQNLRRHLKRLDGGEVQLREISDPDELPAAFDLWQGFRERQWEAAGKDINPEHLSVRFKAFLLDVTRALLPSGQALVWEFRIDDRPVGMYVNFADAESFHWYLGGFDPAVAAVGIGKIAIGHGIRTSIELGRRRYDFGRGAEEYKYWYGAVDRQLGGLVAGNPRLRSRAVVLGARVMAARR